MSTKSSFLPKSLFTLTQKVFVVRSYYQGGGAGVDYVLSNLSRRYGRLFNDDNLDEISQIVKTFERTGSIQGEFYYKRAVVRPTSNDAPHSSAGKRIVEQSLEIVNEEEEELVEDQEEEVETEEVVVEPDPTSNDAEYVEVQMAEDELIIEVVSDFEDDHQAKASESQLVEKLAAASKSVICEQCGEAVLKRDVAQHRLQCHGERPVSIKCDLCDEELSSKRRWYTHRRKHMPATHFVCDICAKVSTSSSIHKNHLLVSIIHSTSSILANQEYIHYNNGVTQAGVFFCMGLSSRQTQLLPFQFEFY